MNVAFIGLGAMGLPIARRLASRPEFALTLVDTRPERLEAARTIGVPARSVAEAVRDADLICSVLPADAHVESVAAEVEAAAHAGQTFVEFSTIGPATIERVAARLSRVSVRTVSVALTRGTAAAEAGKLTLFVGTDGELPAVVSRAFEAIATEALVVGGLGAAKALKIANNMVLGCLDVLICEALILARKCGIPARALAVRLAVGGCGSWALREQIEKHVFTDDLGPGRFSTRYMAKDMRLYLDMTNDLGRSSHLCGAVLAAYRGVIAAGHGEDYHPVVIRWLERTAGLEAGSAVTLEGDATSDEAIDDIVRGVFAAQVCVDLDALAVLAGHGIATKDAARFLASGSAANDALAPAAQWLAGAPVLEADRLVAALDRVIDLANSHDLPALLLENARQDAVALLGSAKKNSTQFA